MKPLRSSHGCFLCNNVFLSWLTLLLRVKIIAHLTMLAIILGYAIPRYYDALIPVERRGEGSEPTMAMETKGELGGRSIANMAERGETPPEYESDEDRARVKVSN